MREAYFNDDGIMRTQSGRATARSAADWLCLAAAPTFAIMALLTSVGGGPADILCAGSSPLGGMTAMYLLMSAFHLPPWLTLIARSAERSTLGRNNLVQERTATGQAQ